MDASKMQVDGSHYTEMAMQPIELTYLIGGTPCFCKLAKYGSRKKHSDRTIDLNKAIHCIRLEQDFAIKNENHLTRNYPITYTDPCNIEMAMFLINIFTEDQNLRDALILMHTKSYERAVISVQEIIKNVTV